MWVNESQEYCKNDDTIVRHDIEHFTFYWFLVRETTYHRWILLIQVTRIFDVIFQVRLNKRL